ncbi:ABC transporter substrate-binding protein [Streptosporangiaceae bacterium NEAU-GS5]|nr:ABC transporter substrate-binding protein [Streptosporangiaceae bacterium NEAU-GS5]
MRVSMSAKIVAGAALLALAVSACGGGSSTTSSGASGGAAANPIKVYIGEPQNDLIPGNTGESSGAEVIKGLYVGLVSYDQNAKPQLNLAESVTPDDTATNWTIKLKPGYTWSDGTPVTAQNFVDAWNYTALGSNAQQLNYYLSVVKGYDDMNPAPDTSGATPAPKATELSGLKVVDDTTFTVELTHPFSGFETELGYSAFFPLPKAAFGADKKISADYAKNPVTNGPFKLAKPYARGTDQAIEVVRNDTFKGGKAKADAIEYKIYTDMNTAYNDLLAGNLDVMDVLPDAQIPTAKATFGDRYIEQASSGVGWLGFNIQTGGDYAQNPELRKAISMSIDRKTITDTVFSGARTPADDNLSPLIPGYRQGACGEACTYDPAKAKALWDANGGGKVKEVTLSYNADGGHKNWIEAAANNIRTALGITVTPKPYEKFALILDDLGKKKVQGAFRMAWLMDYPSPEDYLRPIFGTGGSSNYVQYSNKQLDDLLNKADSASSADEGIKLYQQADDLALKDLAYVPIYFYKVNAAYSQNVKNVVLDPYEALDVMSIERA